MNIEFAKTIPMPEFLNKQGFSPVSTRGNQYKYLSPLRNEKTPSFFVNIEKNVWYDHGEGIGGDLIIYVCEYLKRYKEGHTVIDALRYIKNIGGYTYRFPKDIRANEEPTEAALKLKSAQRIKHAGLIEYLAGRGIPLYVAQQYLQQLFVFNKNTGKSFYTLGIQNEDKGYELRNPYFKGTLGTKSYSFIRGLKPNSGAITLFEGMMDYGAIIAQREGKPLDNDVIILHSLACIQKATDEIIRNYGYENAYTWFDNDGAGRKASEAFAEFCKTEPGLKHQPMNQDYAPYKDVNAAHMAKLGL